MLVLAISIIDIENCTGGLSTFSCDGVIVPESKNTILSVLVAIAGSMTKLKIDTEEAGLKGSLSSRSTTNRAFAMILLEALSFTKIEKVLETFLYEYVS